MEKLKNFLSAYYYHLITILLIGLLSYSNFKQRGQLKIKQTEIDQYSEALSYNAFLSSLSSKKFPFEESFKGNDWYSTNSDDYLVIVANFRVCSKCLRDELGIINNFRQQLQNKGIQPVIVFGIKNNSEKEKILKYKRLDLVNIPYITVDYLKLNNFIPLLYEDGYSFIENPQYLRLDNNLQIVDTYKPPKLKSTKVRDWILESI